MRHLLSLATAAATLPHATAEREILLEQDAHELRLVEEHYVRPMGAPPVYGLPVDLATFVSGFLDADFTTQDQARDAAERTLARYAGRTLTQSEQVKITLAIALEWNRRHVAPSSVVMVVAPLTPGSR